MSVRHNVMLGTAGHVDHGKTALVKLLTGCDTDRLAEEKQRGLTIELGFAPCRMRDDRILGIIDVPGHMDFIRNMVAGAQGIDVVILVVAADDGVMPQTREHLDILTLMGVRHGLVALTKIDLVDDEMRQLAIDELREALEGTFLAGADICPVSNITGEGFEGFFEALNAAVEACEGRPGTGLFRMWIERTFSMPGFGAIVSGIPASGQVRVGDRLTLAGGEGVGRVRGLEVYGEDAPSGLAGECVAINLADLDPARLGRGCLLAEGDAFEAVTMAEAELALLAGLPSPLKDYAEVHVHVGTAEAMAHVAMLEGRPLEPGERQFVQLRLVEPLAMAAGDRFVIRAGLSGLAGGRVTTLGGGRVLSTSNIRLRRNRPWTLAALAARREGLDDPTAWASAILREAGAPTPLATLARRAQRRPEQLATSLRELAERGQAREVDGAWVHAESLSDARQKLLGGLDAFHAANPMRAGLEQAELLAGAGLDASLARLALEALVAEDAVRRQGTIVAQAGKGALLAPADQADYDRIEARLRQAHLEPPLPGDLAAELGIAPDRLERMLRLLTDRQLVVPLDRKVVMHSQAVAAAQEVLLGLFARAGSFETVEFRDALGVSRKFAVPLLDYFDTIRWTARSGSLRRPGVEARKRLEAAE